MKALLFISALFISNVLFSQVTTSLVRNFSVKQGIFEDQVVDYQRSVQEPPDNKMSFRLDAGVSLNQGPGSLADHMSAHDFDRFSPGGGWFNSPSVQYPTSKPLGFYAGLEFSRLFEGYGVGTGLRYVYNGSATGSAQSVYLNQGVEMTKTHFVSIAMSSLSFELFYETRKNRMVNLAVGPLLNLHRMRSMEYPDELDYSISFGLFGELIRKPFGKGIGLKLGGLLSTNARIGEFKAYSVLPFGKDLSLPEGRINLSYFYGGLYLDL